ncbi:hypothetical protein K504DRAFT_53521 [Pleomassaria siparia CBS 279.74]|uniref:Uncharacterized protein n=1 Tax=Pleomassaria siparia CBS 279.74 TaxID=1314801 RepID=A0A6G1K4G7_9PLEO|nr:hypothetical protein K504DRAFT_53521 [Pleomassaria siparia CBS 279.74]
MPGTLPQEPSCSCVARSFPRPRCPFPNSISKRRQPVASIPSACPHPTLVGASSSTVLPLYSTVLLYYCTVHTRTAVRQHWWLCPEGIWCIWWLVHPRDIDRRSAPPSPFALNQKAGLLLLLLIIITFHSPPRLPYVRTLITTPSFLRFFLLRHLRAPPAATCHNNSRTLSVLDTSASQPSVLRALRHSDC